MVKRLDLNNYKSYSGGIYIHENAEVAEDVEIGIGCVIHEDVIIEEGSSLNEYCIIRPEVRIGKKCKIHDSVELGYNYREGMKTIIGDDSIIRRNTTLYAGNTFGNGFQTGASVVIRENCHFGKYCAVGTLSQFEGFTKVGKFSRFHTSVHITQNSEIGNYVWIFPYVVSTNDKFPPYDVVPPSKSHKGPIIKDYALITTGSLLMPGVIIGKDSMVGAGSVVSRNVPEGELWMGVPARFLKKVEDISWDVNFSKLIGIEKPYPYRKYFKRDGYVFED